jgi:hypothetical protein
MPITALEIRFDKPEGRIWIIQQHKGVLPLCAIGKTFPEKYVITPIIPLATILNAENLIETIGTPCSPANRWDE